MNLTAEQMEAKKKEIREGNDLLRTTFFPFLGKVVLTEGVANNPLKEKVLLAIREFYQFDGGNDPHHEHDFGTVEIESEAGEYCKKRSKWYERFFFKIDYCDLKLEFGADPYQEPFKRILTIMEAERSNFHRVWAPENLKGLSLTEAYQMANNHIFVVAVIAVYGMREYKSSVRMRWEEVNKRMIR